MPNPMSAVPVSAVTSLNRPPSLRSRLLGAKSLAAYRSGVAVAVVVRPGRLEGVPPQGELFALRGLGEAAAPPVDQQHVGRPVVIAEAVPLPAPRQQLSRLAPRHQLEHLAQPVPGVVVGVGGEVDVEQSVPVEVRGRDRSHEIRQGGNRQGRGAVGETTLLVGEEEAALEGSANEGVGIAVVVEIGEDGAGAEVLEVETGLAGDVPEGPVSLVVEEEVLPPRGHDVDVVVPVHVEVDDRNARLLVKGRDVEQDVPVSRTGRCRRSGSFPQAITSCCWIDSRARLRSLSSGRARSRTSVKRGPAASWVTRLFRRQRTIRQSSRPGLSPSGGRAGSCPVFQRVASFAATASSSPLGVRAAPVKAMSASHSCPSRKFPRSKWNFACSKYSTRLNRGSQRRNAEEGAVRSLPSSGHRDVRTATPGSSSPEPGPVAARSVNDTCPANSSRPARWGSCRFSTSLPSRFRRGVSDRIASSVARIPVKSAVPPAGAAGRRLGGGAAPARFRPEAATAGNRSPAAPGHRYRSASPANSSPRISRALPTLQCRSASRGPAMLSTSRADPLLLERQPACLRQVVAADPAHVPRARLQRLSQLVDPLPQVDDRAGAQHGRSTSRRRRGTGGTSPPAASWSPRRARRRAGAPRS